MQIKLFQSVWSAATLFALTSDADHPEEGVQTALFAYFRNNWLTHLDLTFRVRENISISL